MSTKEAKRRAVAKYDATHTRFYGVKLNIETDADIIALLDAVENKQRVIKTALREYAKKTEGGG